MHLNTLQLRWRQIALHVIFFFSHISAALVATRVARRVAFEWHEYVSACSANWSNAKQQENVLSTQNNNNKKIKKIENRDRSQSERETTSKHATRSNLWQLCCVNAFARAPNVFITFLCFDDFLSFHLISNLSVNQNFPREIFTWFTRTQMNFG